MIGEGRRFEPRIDAEIRGWTPISFPLSTLSFLVHLRRTNWAYRERLQLVSRSPQVLGGDQTIPENKTCSRRGGAFVSAGLVADAVRRSSGGRRQKARRAPTAEDKSGQTSRRRTPVSGPETKPKGAKSENEINATNHKDTKGTKTLGARGHARGVPLRCLFAGGTPALPGAAGEALALRWPPNRPCWFCLLPFSFCLAPTLLRQGCAGHAPYP